MERGDAACFIRDLIADGRRKGPEAFAHALRSVLKCGRRYKVPTLTVAPEDNGHHITDRQQILQALGVHLAIAETGVPSTISAALGGHLGRGVQAEVNLQEAAIHRRFGTRLSLTGLRQSCWGFFTAG